MSSGDLNVKQSTGEAWNEVGSHTTGNPPAAKTTGIQAADDVKESDNVTENKERGTTSIPTPPGFNGEGGPGAKAASLAAEEAATSASQFLWPESDPEPAESERSSSFNQLAAALGNGLAESMEDATRGDLRKYGTSSSDPSGDAPSTATPTAVVGGGTSGGAAGLTDNFFNNANQNDLAYERHKRHMNSRLLGSSAASSKDPFANTSHTAPEAGNLFGTAFDTGDATDGGLAATDLGGAPATRLSSGFSPNAASFRPATSYPSLNAQQSSFDDGNGNSKTGLPVTKDLGLAVMEPSDISYGGARGLPTPSLYGLDKVAKRHQDGTYGIQRDMQNLWSDPNRGGSISPKPSDRSMDSIDAAAAGNGRGGSYPLRLADSSNGILEAEEELRPFTWDINHHEPSRALAVLRAVGVSPTEIRSLCESFGVVETFRSEFFDRGVVFVSFCDMRCAQFAAMQLPSRLQRLGSGAQGVIVKFCVPLNSSSQNDDSLVVVNDLPAHVSVESLAHMLSSFGAIRSLRNLGGNFGGISYVAEFHDVQDARQVVLELDSTQPWGPNVSIEVGSRNQSDRKKGRELLALIGRWRGKSGVSLNNRGPPVSADPGGMYRPQDARGMGHMDPRYSRGMPPPEPSLELVLGPDGRYTYANPYMAGGGGGYPPYGGGGIRSPRHPGDHYGGHGGYVPHGAHAPPPPQQQYYHQPQPRNFHSGGSVVSGGSYHSGQRSYYGDDRSIGSHSNVRSLPTNIGSLAGSTSDGQNQHLMLDLDAVENGMDTRTSLMVRNIPNKYTQQMLLSEFTENGHGPGIIDFFYLPIDFKNRCNRGYAFINFVDYRDILMFHRQYYGKHWRTFNSDKICDITYARIQGKAAMLKRFENSALMEKDDEYKPLVFVSNGPDKGKRLPFPADPRAV